MTHRGTDAAAAARGAVETLWTALGGPSGDVDQLRIGPGGAGLASPLPVGDLALGSVGAAALAAAELARQRRPAADPAPSIDPAAVGAAFASERFLRRDGDRSAGWAPLSGFWAARDGWIRTHANYAHHRSRLLGALGLGEDADAPALAARLARLDGQDVEQRVAAAGGLAVAVRDPATWAVTDVGAWLADQPLLRLGRSGDAPPAVLARAPATAIEDPRPAAGIRVLDLTRVIAGPIASRTLAHLGADVLRVDAPGSPEIPFQHIDTGFGKRSALLDLADHRDRTRFEELLAGADVLIDGYRPGSLAAYGLAADEIHQRHPHVVVASLCAWGSTGPWSARRGFDSLVQAATGIAMLSRADPAGALPAHAPPGATPDEAPPGALPAQALDHATGYLIAAAVLRSLTERARSGGSRTVDASLAQTATWLLSRADPDAPAHAEAEPADAAPWLRETAGEYGLVRHVLPPVRLAGLPADWAHGPVIWGTSGARWTAPAS